jgi:hypothetical protein
MQLLNGEPAPLTTKGAHVVTVRLNGGTAKIQYQVREGMDFADLPDSTYTTDADEVKTLPFCKLKAVLTGGATIDINQASM